MAKGALRNAKIQKLFLWFFCLAFISLACLSPKEPFATPGEPATLIRPTATPAAAVTPSALPSPSWSESECAVISADEALHLRVGPDEHSRSLAFMTSGEVVKLISAANVDWWKIKIGDQIGYARSKYLEKSECEGRP